MHLDIRELASGEVLSGDICIVGAGPAGVSLASEFRNSLTTVLMLESGGVGFDPETQELSKGQVVTQNYEDLESVRVRMLGGTSNHWTGLLRVLAEQDLESLPWLPGSGWPFGMTELGVYYERAKSIFGIQGLTFDAAEWFQKLNISAPRLDTRVLDQEVSVFNPVNFGLYAEKEIFNSSNISIYTHANAYNLRLTDDGNQIESIDVRTLDGKRFTARAKCYVLATGGLENARILLASDGVQKDGVGNQHDTVGRYFMEHPYYGYAGQIFTSAETASSLRNVYQRHQWRSNTQIVPHLRLSSEYRKERRLLNSLIRLRSDSRNSPAVDSLVRARRLLKEGKIPPHLANAIQDVLVGIDDVALYFADPSGAPSSPYLGVTAEQAPNWSSRVALGNDRDALGMRRIILEWRFSEIDKESFRSTVLATGASLAESGLGRLRSWVQYGDDLADRPPFWAYHHMGTTRMGIDRKTSVVDPNCRVHSVANLYVAGSSVFPTGGSVTPTFTIVALSIRLGDHLKNILKG